MAYSSEVKDYAKELFLTVSPDGKHKFTRKEIVEKISRKFPDLKKVPSGRLISTWSTTKDKSTLKSWVDLWERGVRHGIQNAVLENEEKLSQEEQLEIQVDKITGLRAGNAILAAEKISQKLKNNERLCKEDLALWRESERTFNNLNFESDENPDNYSRIDLDYLDELYEEPKQSSDTSKTNKSGQ